MTETICSFSVHPNEHFGMAKWVLQKRGQGDFSLLFRPGWGDWSKNNNQVGIESMTEEKLTFRSKTENIALFGRGAVDFFCASETKLC